MYFFSFSFFLYFASNYFECTVEEVEEHTHRGTYSFRCLVSSSSCLFCVCAWVCCYYLRCCTERDGSRFSTVFFFFCSIIFLLHLLLPLLLHICALCALPKPKHVQVNQFRNQQHHRRSRSGSGSGSSNSASQVYSRAARASARESALTVTWPANCTHKQTHTHAHMPMYTLIHSSSHVFTHTHTYTMPAPYDGNEKQFCVFLSFCLIVFFYFFIRLICCFCCYWSVLSHSHKTHANGRAHTCTYAAITRVDGRSNSNSSSSDVGRVSSAHVHLLMLAPLSHSIWDWTTVHSFDTEQRTERARDARE